MFIVFNENKQEAVAFDDKKDALYAATGIMEDWSCSTLADSFRQSYAYDEPEKQFEMREFVKPE